MVIMPAWVQDIMGERERRIANHPKARSLCEDRDGNRLPYYQRIIEIPSGTWEQVREEWSKAGQMGYQTVLQAAKVGQMLIELKAVTPHKGDGNFRARSEIALPGVSTDTIGNLMTLARNLPLIEQHQPDSQRAASNHRRRAFPVSLAVWPPLRLRGTALAVHQHGRLDQPRSPRQGLSGARHRLSPLCQRRWLLEQPAQPDRRGLSMTETHIPVRQRPAREQQAAGVLMPYFLPDTEKAMSGPLNYHLTMVKFPVNVLDRLVVAARKVAAATPHLRNPLDNRGDNLDYPAMPREKVAFLRHACLNRTLTQLHMLNGYSGSYDNILSKIDRKGVDVKARQLDLRLAVLRLITETYPELALECEEQAFHARRTYELENPQ